MRVAKKLLLVPILFGLGILYSPTSTAQSSCGNMRIKGDYGFAGTGLVPQKPNAGSVSFDPMNEIAAVSYDGAQGVSAKVRIQYHGSVGPTSTITGNYHVNSDCTGIAEFKDSSGVVISTWNFVIVHSGEEIETMALIPATSSRPMYSMNFSQKKI